MHIQPNTHLPKTPKIKLYTALLTQTATDPPIATILHNTIGTITWTYEGVGEYNAISTGLFPQNKTFIITAHSEGVNVQFYPARLDENTIQILAYNTGSAGDVWTNLNLEIRVYDKQPITLL